MCSWLGWRHSVFGRRCSSDHENAIVLWRRPAAVYPSKLPYMLLGRGASETRTAFHSCRYLKAVPRAVLLLLFCLKLRLFTSCASICRFISSIHLAPPCLPVLPSLVSRCAFATPTRPLSHWGSFRRSVSCAGRLFFFCHSIPLLRSQQFHPVCFAHLLLCAASTWPRHSSWAGKKRYAF
ncbi:hypothetical protein DL89DRAFT_181326 [Linderina pennispora]|uniref:Uncharacterized protein n=1 Tax=Linderina pennispora TaxID=61395 RepID=A0A1Y1W5Y8_9FUNG|nr:uncharacterized protein DL89DRAFT_181326 [Linderina pennispora]ORX68646.1 hypothetical protein DL89DRAFT_181326 [Linderina pennispora]